MAETINMPKLGFDMAEGTLVRWVKKIGETVNKGEVLAEIETDKATVEVESSASGVVRLRRRGHQHRLFPRSLEPVQDLEPARAVGLREQPVRHGHGCGSRLGR